MEILNVRKLYDTLLKLKQIRPYGCIARGDSALSGSAKEGVMRIGEETRTRLSSAESAEKIGTHY